MAWLTGMGGAVTSKVCLLPFVCKMLPRLEIIILRQFGLIGCRVADWFGMSAIAERLDWNQIERQQSAFSSSNVMHIEWVFKRHHVSIYCVWTEICWYSAVTGDARKLIVVQPSGLTFSLSAVWITMATLTIRCAMHVDKTFGWLV